MRPQKAQTAQNDRLEAAIDQVAARMVAVPDDPEMALRIAGALPDRASRLGWLIPQLAALGAIVIAAVVWSMREQPAIVLQVLPSTEIAAVSAFPRVDASAPVTVVSTLPSEPSEPPELSEPDFERSLPALEAVDALVVSDLTPRELPASPALVLAPIGVTELPLTAESFPPR